MPEELFEPESRIEAILENILGADNPIGEPQSRNEYLLIQIMEMMENEPATPVTEEEIDVIMGSLS